MNNPRVSLELTLDRVGNEVRIGARSSRGEALAIRPLGLDLPTLQPLSRAIQRAAMHGMPTDKELLERARALQEAILAEGTGALLARLSEASGGQVLVRFMMHDPDLQQIPWESACNAQEALGYWATSAQVFPVRGVLSGAPWAPREIRGAVKVLAIAPTDKIGLTNLQQALQDRMETGEVEWLDPIVGAAARVSVALDRLRREPIPNVIHFLGHGTIDSAGRPALRFADIDDEESWLPVELLAQQLSASLRGMLRLVVLEACEGAKPSAFASAAELLARSGADAVVAHSWPVRADVARTCSTAFYRAITSSERNAGDVAVGLNEARRAILATHETSAEALGPVLYLRGPDGKIFDFKGRKITAPQKNVSSGVAATELPKSLVRIVQKPFSLVLGDSWKDEQSVVDKFREKLRKEVATSNDPRDGLPLSMLAQWFALRKGVDKLGSEFQKTYRASMEAPALIMAIAKLLRPGLHTTLLRLPWLEQCLAEARPDRTICVIQPHDSGASFMQRAAHTDSWEELDEPPTEFDLEEAFLILRPCRGYTPELVFSRPLLTEDDYYLRLRELWSPHVIPVDLKNAMQTTLGYRPTMMLGLSVLTAHHRMLLHTLYTRGLPRESLAIIEQDAQESPMWRSGAGLPGRDEGTEVLEISAPDLEAALVALGAEVT